jgi:hypothetical protein
MTVQEIIADLEEAEESQGCYNPEIYIRIGLYQVKASRVEYCPETDDEEEAIIIS